MKYKFKKKIRIFFFYYKSVNSVDYHNTRRILNNHRASQMSCRFWLKGKLRNIKMKDFKESFNYSDNNPQDKILLLHTQNVRFRYHLKQF